MSCAHETFENIVTVHRLIDIGRYTVEVQIRCADCKKEFRFIGLPRGVDLNGAATNINATVATLAIAPVGETVPPITGTSGYTVRGPENKK